MSIAQTVKVQQIEKQLKEHALRLEEAEKVLRALPPRPSKPIAEARAFLEEALAQGPRHATDLLKLAADKGIAERTLRRSKAQLGVSSLRVRPAAGRRPGCYWRL